MANPQSDPLSVATLEPGILGVTLNRPERRNAFDTPMIEALRELWTRLYADSDDVRAVILTGAGERAFCAGADLKERDGLDEAAWHRQHAILEQAMRAMLDCPLPIIAAVNGAAIAGGLELVLAADFAYGVPGAHFAFTELGRGIMPGAAGTQTLPRAVGARRAKEIILTGAPFDSAEALAWGLLNRVVPREELMETALAAARRIAANAPVAVIQAKKALNIAADTDLGTGYRFEIEAYGRTIDTDDRREGIRAFNEKRPPSFRGR